jgi:hypothetical protein
MSTSSGGPQPVCACRRMAASPAGPAPIGPIRERRDRLRHVRHTRRAAAWALPSVALALVPKCPMCVAAYLAIGGGLGVSLSTAAHLRTAVVWLGWSALALLAARMVLRSRTRFRTRRRDTTATALSARRNTRRSPARTAAA